MLGGNLYCIPILREFKKKVADITSVASDSLAEENFRLLKEFAICQCLYAVPETHPLKDLDISSSVYANLLGYNGIDTLNRLAKIEGEKIVAEKYVDYNNKKAGFLNVASGLIHPACFRLCVNTHWSPPAICNRPFGS